MSPCDSAQSQRHENLRIVTLNQQRNVLADSLGGGLKLLDRFYAFAVHAENDVTGLHARRCGGTAHVFDDQVAIGLRLLLLLRGKRPHRQAELARLIGAMTPAVHGAAGFVLIKERNPNPNVLLLTAAPYAQLRVGTRLDARDNRGQLSRALDQTAIDCDNDVARLKSRFLAGAAALHRTHQRAARPVQTEGLCQLCIDVLDRYPNASARNVSRLYELLAHIHRNVDGNCERQTHVAAGAAEDLRIDADHFALHVEERAARVAGVDRHVGLNEGHIAIAVLTG